MASLQIRHLPDEIYEALPAGSSLAQQAVAELRAQPELDSWERRLRIVERLRAKTPLAVNIPPEELIREDRDR